MYGYVHTLCIEKKKKVVKIYLWKISADFSFNVDLDQKTYLHCLCSLFIMHTSKRIKLINRLVTVNMKVVSESVQKRLKGIAQYDISSCCSFFITILTIFAISIL